MASFGNYLLARERRPIQLKLEQCLDSTKKK